MASSSIAVDASTLGRATPEDLRVAQLNLGLVQANSFSHGRTIEEHLDTLQRWILDMSKHVHIIVLNELHPAHRAGLGRRLEQRDGLSFVGAKCGDALIWCLIIMS